MRHSLQTRSYTTLAMDSHDASAFTISQVPEVGLEPTRHYWQGILSPQRLPFRHSGIGNLR